MHLAKTSNMQVKIIFFLIALVVGDRISFNRTRGVSAHAKVELKNVLIIKQQQHQAQQLQAILKFYGRTNPKTLKILLQKLYKNKY